MTLLRLVWNFLLHILFGTLFFCIIAAVAVGLHFLVAWAEKIGLPRPMALAFEGLEYVVFALDTLAYVVFLIVVFLKFVREAYQHWQDEDEDENQNQNQN
jgi:hypothetical protein